MFSFQVAIYHVTVSVFMKLFFNLRISLNDS
jgi:hypothetical protein